MERRWHVLTPDPEQVGSLSDALRCQPAVAAALVNRGISNPDLAEVFLRPSFAHVRSPFLMKDVDLAVERILLTLRHREKVLIFGDYDTDGITATALLFEFLAYLGVDVHCHIPDRMTEGYGLSQEYIEAHAVPDSVDLVITVDCGISSHDAVNAAGRAGIDVIITDHHEPPPSIPAALAVLNPKQADCPSGFSWLAGVGVAFNLVLALRKRLRDDGYWDKRQEPNLKAACDLVALGTVGDMAPLVEENRIYVKAGLEVLASDSRPGVQALLDVSKLTNRSLSTRDLAFRLAPRLNAPGRLFHASSALTLLTTPSIETARAIAKELDQQNTKRREIENLILSEITQRLEKNPELLEQRALILDEQGWHQGVIGIVASRLVNRYEKPSVVIAVTDGIGKGSARSPDGFDLYEGLKICSRHLERFGGHKAAAGLTLRAENIPGFRKDFERVVSEKIRPEESVPELLVDSEISASDVLPELADELEALAPFGVGNPEPVFMISDADLLTARRVGNRHLQMRFRPSASGNVKKNKSIDAIFFNQTREVPQPGNLYRIACHVRWNRWREQKKMQLVIKALDAVS
ncbi:MAG: single-stranded-DNA-specific exonuclease RecJ [Deltaproteobacteria bacterium]|nr:single-stranded-DNA-specific exonuclease RecJ [Deltaproteobacteria bacterium]